MDDERTAEYDKAIGDKESLALFVESMREFDRQFCDHIIAGDDFTIKLEVHGCAGQMIHSRVNSDGFKRPRGVEKRVEEQKKKSRGG